MVLLWSYYDDLMYYKFIVIDLVKKGKVVGFSSVLRGRSRDLVWFMEKNQIIKRVGRGGTNEPVRRWTGEARLPTIMKRGVSEKN